MPNLEEFADEFQEDIEPIVVYPMAGIFDLDHLDVTKMPHPAILARIGRPALSAVNEKRWAADASP